MTRFRSAALRVANALSATASLALVLLIVAGPRATTPELAALTATAAASVLTGALIRREHTDQPTDHENGNRR